MRASRKTTVAGGVNRIKRVRKDFGQLQVSTPENMIYSTTSNLGTIPARRNAAQSLKRR